MERGPLTKSLWLDATRCPKLLWYGFHQPSAFPPDGPAVSARKTQGAIVGELARQRYPDGILLESDPSDPGAILAATREALARRRPLFEAAFAAREAFARVDLLVPADRGRWDLIEVKSGTGVEEIHREDAAFQYAVVTAAGVRLRCVLLLHLDGSYVRRGEIDPAAIFHETDVTTFARSRRRKILAELATAARPAEAERCPEVPIGPPCITPDDCPLKPACWAFLPPRNVLELYRDTKYARGFGLLRRGIVELAGIPDDLRLTPRQAIQREASRGNRAHVNAAAIRQFLAPLEYPLSFLDFETFQTAIPMFDGLKPWAQVPFQFSLHVQAKRGRRAVHRAFLAEGAADPRAEFLRHLKQALPPSGTILAYYAAFEKGVLSACARAFPGEARWIRDVQSRVVDLLGPFGNFDCYHPDQHGSASIKEVLPVLTRTSYQDLEIRDGATAASEFHRVTYSPDPQRDVAEVRERLSRYCERDTQAMVDVLAALESLVADPPSSGVAQ